jgi:hypothetical protein
MSSQSSVRPDYEQLYRILKRRRGEELFLLKKIALNVAGLVDTFESTDSVAADCAEKQDDPPPPAVDQYIHAFLWKLDPRYQQKRYKDTWLTLKVMLTEGENLKTMTDIYAKVAEEANATPDRIDRSIRSYRKAAAESDAAYSRENIAEFNESNASFCWNATRLLRLDLQRPLSASGRLLPL